MTAVTARIGISGWRYRGWRGKFYPKGLPQKSELHYAAERFDTVELNGSFYSLQRPQSYASWYAEVPEHFVFAIKGSRYITHMLRLEHVETALANFFASGLFELKEKLGPILWQLPPTLRYESGRLEAFFASLPRTSQEAESLARRHDERVAGRMTLDAPVALKFRYALEVRHPSFATPEFIELMRREQIALVVADTAGKWPLLEDVTANFVYVRLHGDEKLYESGYTDHALDDREKRLRAWMKGSQPNDARTASSKAPPRRAHRDVYVCFDNDIKVHAPFDAMRLAQRLGTHSGRGQPVSRRNAASK